MNIRAFPEGPAPDFILGAWKDSCHNVTLKVAGDSMAPAIQPGDTVTIVCANSHRLLPGDVVAFLERGRIIVHRVLAIKPAGGKKQYCQKGDSLSGWSWLTEDDLLGRITAIQRNGERILLDDGSGTTGNRLACFLIAGSIAAYEKLRQLKEILPWERPFPLLSWIFRSGIHLLQKGIQRTSSVFADPFPGFGYDTFSRTGKGGESKKNRL